MSQNTSNTTGNSQLVYGLHAVQSLLKRHPDRVLQLQLAERRDDPRMRAIEALAREHGTKVLRVDAQVLQKPSGTWLTRVLPPRCCRSPRGRKMIWSAR
jgi:tRNA G18 (ribose-2'-O)-methylase SpoU